MSAMLCFIAIKELFEIRPATRPFVYLALLPAMAVVAVLIVLLLPGQIQKKGNQPFLKK
jgi:hypothetical protein